MIVTGEKAKLAIMQINPLTNKEFFIAEIDKEISIEDLRKEDKKMYISVISYHMKKIIEDAVKDNLSEKIETSDMIITEIYQEIVKGIINGKEVYYCDYYYGFSGIEGIKIMRIKSIEKIEYTEDAYKAIKSLEERKYAILKVKNKEILLTKEEKGIKAELI